MTTVSPQRFRPQQRVLIKCPANPAWKVPARPPMEVTVRQLSDKPEDSQRPYVVTVDEGLCAGLRLWAAEAELMERN